MGETMGSLPACTPAIQRRMYQLMSAADSGKRSVLGMMRKEHTEIMLRLKQTQSVVICLGLSRSPLLMNMAHAWGAALDPGLFLECQSVTSTLQAIYYSISCNVYRVVCCCDGDQCW